MTLPHITKGEWKRLWISILILMLFSSAPYLAGWIKQDADHIFSGAVIDRTDYSVYLSAIHDGAQGKLTYRLKFTTEPQTEGVYLRLFYHFVGFAGRLVNLAPQTAFHAARIFFGILALIAVYLLCAASFLSAPQRQFAFMLISLGSGLGWLKVFLLKPGAQLPVDFWMPEPFTLYSIFAFPHFSTVTMCIALIIVLFSGFTKKNSILALGCMIVLGLFAQQVNPISPFIIEIAIAGICLCNWVNAKRIIWSEFFAVCLITVGFVPQFIYQQFVLRNYPLWAGYSAQNITPSPSLSEYFWGFGFFAVLAVPAVFYALKTKRNNIVYASALWVIAVFIAAYFPVAFQRRFLHAVMLPFGLLISYLVFNVEAFPFKDRIPAMLLPLKRNGSLALISLFSVSTLILFLQLTLFAIRQPDSTYDPRAVILAANWLGRHAQPEDAVLCVERTSQVIAERTGLTVYLGHWVETYDYGHKTEMVKSFYEGNLSKDWLRTARVQWVVAGPFEGTNRLSGLEPVYTLEGVTIYSLEK
jgi:hypothetical protein